MDEHFQYWCWCWGFYAFRCLWNSSFVFLHNHIHAHTVKHCKTLLFATIFIDAGSSSGTTITTASITYKNIWPREKYDASKNINKTNFGHSSTANSSLLNQNIHSHKVFLFLCVCSLACLFIYLSYYFAQIIESTNFSVKYFVCIFRSVCGLSGGVFSLARSEQIKINRSVYVFDVLAGVVIVIYIVFLLLCTAFFCFCVKVPPLITGSYSFHS